MSEIPYARIEELKRQGLGNNQIIQTLQRQGYSTTEVFDALTESSAPRPAAQTPAVALNTQPPPAARMAIPQPPSYAPAPVSYGGGDNEELIEAIIDEKWNDLMGDINKVIAWKESTEGRITRLEQQLTDVKDQFEKLHAAVIGKVGEYDQHVLEIGADIKAMEKVFSKVLPVFTDNVAELSRITDAMRQKK